MKTYTLTVPRLPTAILAVGVIAAAIIGITAFIARADTPPTITTTVQNSSNVAISSATIGTVVHASVTVASTTASTTSTGTVDFNLYNNLSCTGTPTTQASVALVSGVAQSATTSVGAAGLSYVAHYNGDATNSSGNGACQAITATASSVAVATTLSTSSVLVGSTVTDQAVLSGNTTDATGTVAYSLYSNNLCTLGAQNAGVRTVASGIAASSDNMLFNIAGNYYWKALYSGDMHNSGASSTCVLLQVLPTTTVPVSTTGIVSGTVYNDLNNNSVKDGTEAGLSGFVIQLRHGTSNAAPVVAIATTDANGAYSFGSLALDTYFVEEVNQSAWSQTTGDEVVILSTSTPTGTLNFANVAATSTTVGGGHGDGDGDNDGDDDNGGNNATSTGKGGHGFGHFIHDFVKRHFPNSHDNGKHLGQLKNNNHDNKGNGRGGKDD